MTFADFGLSHELRWPSGLVATLVRDDVIPAERAVSPQAKKPVASALAGPARARAFVLFCRDTLGDGCGRLGVLAIADLQHRVVLGQIALSHGVQYVLNRRETWIDVAATPTDRLFGREVVGLSVQPSGFSAASSAMRPEWPVARPRPSARPAIRSMRGQMFGDVHAPRPSVGVGRHAHGRPTGALVDRGSGRAARRRQDARPAAAMPICRQPKLRSFCRRGRCRSWAAAERPQEVPLEGWFRDLRVATLSRSEVMWVQVSRRSSVRRLPADGPLPDVDRPADMEETTDAIRAQ